jgi:hypothetical protein
MANDTNQVLQIHVNSRIYKQWRNKPNGAIDILQQIWRKTVLLAKILGLGLSIGVVITVNHIATVSQTQSSSKDCPSASC